MKKWAIACVGVGGKGRSDSADANRHGQVVAICDIDENNLNSAAKGFNGAKKFSDYRKMLDEMEKSIDAVTVSTPDHTHAPAAVGFMRAGKHCFIQKPMTHTLEEARLLTEIAKEKNLATQMGNQGTAGSGLREAAAMLQKGVLGRVTQVHVWTNRPVWPQGLDNPTEDQTSKAPEHLNWDGFIGAAPYREYWNGYHPFKWRGWWDFGTGALGDMACHTLNMPFMGLDLRDPVSVEAETSGHNKATYPSWSTITYEFGERNGRAPVTMLWYDGGKKPEADLFHGEKIPNSGALVVGEKGSLFSGGDYGGSYKLLGGAEKIDVEYERSPGHFKEWTDAIKGGKPARSNFVDYAGGLTETVLLGNLAVWFSGQKVEWERQGTLLAQHSRRGEVGAEGVSRGLLDSRVVSFAQTTVAAELAAGIDWSRRLSFLGPCANNSPHDFRT